MFYYKIEKSTELGAKAAKMLREMEKAEDAAETFAAKYGASEYYTDPSHDAGGLIALEFPPTKFVNKKTWENIPMDNTKHCYGPRVTVSEKLVETKEVGSLTENQQVSESEFPFSAVQFRFSREEAAAMAGVKLTTPSLERIGKRNRISRRVLNMISMGAPVENVMPEASEELKTAIRLSQTEDRQIQEAMKNRTFKLVHTLSGTPEAIAIYKEQCALPVVPGGAVNKLLGAVCETHRCGLLDAGEFIYVISAVAIENSALTEAPAEEYEMLLQVQVAKNNANGKEAN